MLDERRQADLFLADLLGTTPRRRAVRRVPAPAAQPVVAPAARPAAAPARGGWSRPDLIFDRRAYRGPDEAEWAEELSDEGWESVAEPHSATPASSLRPNDVVVERALGEGRLTFVKVLGEDISIEALYGPSGLIREDILVLRQQVPTQQFEDVEDAEYLEDLERPRSGTGEATVHLAMLNAHAARGFVYDVSGPNCVLRWTQIPPGFSGAVDVVVHFHGYKAHNKMKLADKAAASGVDFASPGVSRPTLGLVPQGRAFASRIPGTDGFDFPAISSRDELKKFVDAGIAALKAQIGSSDAITAGRVILTGHSGGGAALNLVLRSVGAGEGVRDVHYFDATYGGTAVLVDERGWLRASLARDAQAIQTASSDAERRRIMAERGGSLRLLFIDGSGTAATARAVDQFIAAKLKTLVTDAAVRQFLRGYYRAQKVAKPREIDHGRVPAAFGGRLLSDLAHNLDPDAIDLTPALVAKAKEDLEDVEDVEYIEDTPAAPATLDTVRSTIEGVLQTFRSIPVALPGGGSLAVQVPYFINVASSSSRLRGEQKRPALVRNPELAKLYNGLPSRARVGKSYPADIRTFLKGAVDASAVPGQSSGLTDTGMKGFLSDMGVGVDCSGFVSQALNACMAAVGRSESIDTFAGNLRGGSGANEKQFAVISRPRDLRPGDTMWKKGHIRIISRVDPQSDGSIHFTTAESSSVELVGPVAKTWKCPSADTFTNVQVERDGTFRANGEVNVFSRYRPLADAVGLSLSAKVAAKEDVEQFHDLVHRSRPTVSSPASVDTVRSTIESVLQTFRTIPVSMPGGGSLAVQVPYFINKPGSPSKVRGEQKRPALARNGDLARLYRQLPERARVGKSYPADIRTFLKGAVDASAVPGQSSGLTDTGMKSFLSDMGVGVDCSGFVSQALNACMTAVGRSESINTSSGYLRGGAGANDRQFEVVSRPRDLRPGDTMWKTGHIRIISRVDPQSDGSIHFTTAESSSVELVGPVAKTWKCPTADTFTNIQVERGGTFRGITEVNVFSRYRPLADAFGLSLSTRGAEDDGPTPAPTATRPTPPPPLPPMPQPRPMPGPTPPVSPAPAVPRTLSQAEVARLAAIDFGNAADIDAFFSRKGASGFAGWFNATWAGKTPFKRASGAAIRMGTTTIIQQRFAAFWNSIPTAYDRPRINAIDFASLMCIVLNETGGDFWAHPEKCGGGRSDARGPHPGLAYAFDKIVGVKASYNTLAGNRKAGELFNDADYIRAHGSLGSGSRLSNKGSEFGGRWNSAYYPQSDFSTAEDLTANGFIMQADFYKFRGRGVIQTTSRGAYLPAVSFVQAYAGSNTVLADYKNRWTGMTRDVAATVSTNADWDQIFAQGEMLAKAVRLHSGTGASDYLTMSTQASTLLDVPAPLPKGVPRGTQGSIYFMGRRISGSYSYGSGAYRDRVLGMLSGMLAL